MDRRTLALMLLASCAGDDAPSPARSGTCAYDGHAPDFTTSLGCEADFSGLASEPQGTAIPGARSLKFVLDRADRNALYFQNSRKYRVHWEFASEHLSGRGRPLVPDLPAFNETEYYSPDRRFVLGAVTFYETSAGGGRGTWAFELSPYDTATAEMMEIAFRAVAEAAFFGPELRFHPTSEAVELEAERLGGDIPIVTTDELFDGIDYQPLNLATAVGRLRFVVADDLEESFVGFRDIVVLDRVPNDITVVSGIVTSELQTPLSHVNVLSQNRGTPNMGLRGALEHEALVTLEGKWVRLVVGALDWSIIEVDRAEADAWWEAHRPARVQIPDLDLTVTELTDVTRMLDPVLGQRERIRAAIPAFGGKASHYAELSAAPGVDVPAAFAIPVHFYDQFMRQNGLYDRVARMLADERFVDDARTRSERLTELRDAIMRAPVDEAFARALEDRTARDFGEGTRVRFRSSTNAEDLEGFTGAGLYTSKSGALGDPERPILDAVREVWSSVWLFRAFEERSYRGISHDNVGMAILVHRSFPDELANGVALTANPFDVSGLEPGFYVNVQRGEASVVQPEPGTTTDQFIYQFDRPNRPIIYYGHSSEVPAGETVLTAGETYALGEALDAIHRHFREAYGPPPGEPNAWYAMDVEFKLDAGPDGEPGVVVKQARPHPGRGQ